MTSPTPGADEGLRPTDRALVERTLGPAGQVRIGIKFSFNELARLRAAARSESRERCIAAILAHRPDASFDDSAEGHVERQALLANIVAALGGGASAPQEPAPAGVDWQALRLIAKGAIADAMTMDWSEAADVAADAILALLTKKEG